MSKTDSDDYETEIEDEYEVEAIRKHRYNKHKDLEFFVKWKNYPDADNTWEPESNLATANEIVKQYWADLAEKERQKKTKGSRKRTKSPSQFEKKTKRNKKNRRSPSSSSSDDSLPSIDSPQTKTEKSDSEEEFNMNKKTSKRDVDEVEDDEFKMITINEADKQEDVKKSVEVDKNNNNKNKVDVEKEDDDEEDKDQIEEEENEGDEDDDEYKEEEENDEEKQQPSLKSNNRPNRSIKLVMKGVTDKKEDEKTQYVDTIVNRKPTRKAATNLFFGFNGLTEELRNLDEEDDETYDEAEKEDEIDSDEKTKDDDESDTDDGDGGPATISVSMGMDDDGTVKKYQVIVDPKYIDKSLSWDKDVKKIINVYQNDEENGTYKGVVQWSNGTYSIHSNEELHKKCPQQLIDFYENHLYFRSN